MGRDTAAYRFIQAEGEQVIGRERLFYGSLKIPCVMNSSGTLKALKVRKPQVLQPLALQPTALPGRAA